MKLSQYIVFALCCFFTFYSYGKGKISYTEDEKNVIKLLKSRHKAKDIELISGEDGFKYFLLTHKDGTCFATDSTGRIIIPDVEGFNYILYIPESDVHKTKYIRNSWGYTGNLQTVPVERTFIASKNDRIDFLRGITQNPTFFYNDNGELIKVYDEQLQIYGDNLFTLSSTTDKGDNEYGLISADGKVLIPKIYKHIYPSSSLGHWIIQLCDESTTRTGIYSTTDKKIVIPPLFERVRPSDDGTYMVSLTSYDNLAPYDASKNYELFFPDLGAKLFYQGKYDDVISYYQQTDTIPFGVLLTNLSYYKLSSSYKSAYDKVLAFIKGYDYSSDPSQTLDHNFNCFKRTIIEWDKYRQDHTVCVDSFPPYKTTYIESINFLDWSIKSYERMEREMNAYINSFSERKIQYDIAQKEMHDREVYESQRQERERFEREKRAAEFNREYYEREQRRRESERYLHRLKEKEKNNFNNKNTKPGQHPGANNRNNKQPPTPPQRHNNSNNNNNNNNNNKKNNNNSTSSPGNEPGKYVKKTHETNQKKNTIDVKENFKMSK